MERTTPPDYIKIEILQPGFNHKPINRKFKRLARSLGCNAWEETVEFYDVSTVYQIFPFLSAPGCKYKIECYPSNRKSVWDTSGTDPLRLMDVLTHIRREIAGMVVRFADLIDTD